MKKNKSKFLTLMLAVSMMAGSVFNGEIPQSFAGEEKPKIEQAEENKEDAEKTEEKDDASKKEEGEAKEEEKEIKKDGPNSEKEKDDKDDNKEEDSIAGAIAKEATTLSDESIYNVIIGYEFRDGSFDKWAEGSGFLVTNKDIMTNQTLTDKSSTSSLYKSVLKDKQKMYEKVGVSLNDENALRENLKIKVINGKGEELAIENVISKNGMGLITLSTVQQSSPAIFTDKDNIENKEGNAYTFKMTGQNDKKAEVYEKNLTVVKNDATKDGESFEMEADIEDGLSPLGAPIINKDGNVIGMVSGSGTTVTTIPGNSLQTFLATNGVDYLTASKLKEQKAKEEEETAKKQAEEAVKSAIDTKALKANIKKAEELDPNEYTEETYKVVTDAVNEAKTIMGANDKTQAQIDSANTNITKAIEGLEVQKKLPLLYIIAGGVIFVFFIGMVIMVIKNKKKMQNSKAQQDAANKASKKAKEDELSGYSEFLNSNMENQSQNQNYEKDQGFQEQNNNMNDFSDFSNMDITERKSPKELRLSRNAQVEGLEYAPASYDDDHVGVLNSNDNKFGIDENISSYEDEGSDGTTLLGGGYLIRKDNGKQITIFDDFVIGKEKKKVNYCITNNPTVSRTHARFNIIQGEYYVEDLESKNYTYVNGKQIPPYKKVKLENGSEVRFSNVPFVFYNK